MAGLLKLYFRELPDSVLTRDLAKLFLEAAGTMPRASPHVSMGNADDEPHLRRGARWRGRLAAFQT